jgi:cysteine synthase B
MSIRDSYRVLLLPHRSFESLNAVSYFLMKNSGLTLTSVPGRLDSRLGVPMTKPRTTVVDSRHADLADAAVVRSIGNTPLVRLRRLERHLGLPDSIEIHLKTEWVNPGGSIKDRTALSIIGSALATGELTPGRTLVDATSGNTGIAYAMLGAALEIPVTLVVPESASDERKRTLVAYGADVVYSDPYEGSDGAIRLVREMVAGDPDRFFYADQYTNPANTAAHFTTTGPEVWRQTAGALTHFVAALGTTGTLMGAGRYLRGLAPVQLVGVQPAEAFHGIEGLKHLPTAIVPGIFDPSVPDRIEGIETDEAFDAARALARVEGYFAGSSTGANLAAAARLGSELANEGRAGCIVVIGCDGGSRYLTTGLWHFD